MFADEIGSIKGEMKEIRTKVDVIKTQREQSEHESNLKFDDLSNKFGHLCR